MADLFHWKACSMHRGPNAGDIPSALYDSTEALRLSSTLQAATSFQPSQSCDPNPMPLVGPWQAAAAYLACLALVGQLWEMLGSPPDALSAFKEGQELVRSLQP